MHKIKRITFYMPTVKFIFLIISIFCIYTFISTMRFGTTHDISILPNEIQEAIMGKIALSFIGAMISLVITFSIEDGLFKRVEFNSLKKKLKISYEKEEQVLILLHQLGIEIKT